MRGMDEDWPADSIELGTKCRYNKVYNLDGEWVGIYEYHRNALTGDLCSGYVAFNVSGRTTPPVWIVESLEPLTLSPSILCRTCNHHGFIRNGRWEEC